MDRRLFLQAAAAVPVIAAGDERRIPDYRIVTPYKSTGNGMPGPYRARVSSVHAEDSIDPETETANPVKVREMMRQGMIALTGDGDIRDAWARFFKPDDVVGIKINASGAPNIMSNPAVVGEIAHSLVSVGVNPENIWIHERNKSQVDTVDYASVVPKGVHIVTADVFLGYDPYTYVEVSFFGEDDTRSNMVRLASEKLTKIINVPNMKDHGASGVTGCLKNIAYGEFGNVARSHYRADTHTYSFIGTLAAVGPLRSRTVLQVMDGLKGVWHGGPFAPDKRFRFFPKTIMFGTDPVAIDRLLIDIIEEKRKSENAISVWERSSRYLGRTPRDFRTDPNKNNFIREPGHIEYASKLGLGEYDKARIKLAEVKL